MKGWYVMHRGWMDSFKPEPFTEREAFIWSIERAAIKPHEQWFNGQKIPVERGEFATSIRAMADAFSWSIKRVRGFMDRMGKVQKWAQRTAHSGAQSPTIITVCNYDLYQEPAASEGTAAGTVEGTRRAQSGHSEGTQQNKGNKGNKSKKEESPTDSLFEAASPSRELALAHPVSRLFDANEVDLAFESYQNLRLELKPGSHRVKLTTARRAKLADRLRDAKSHGGWPAVLAKIRDSPFLSGQKPGSDFFAEIDWLLNPKSLLKVVEGNYDDPRSSSPGGVLRVPAGPIDATTFARAAGGFE